MAKSKSVFFCQNCGNEATKWLGKCPACGEWNTYVEEVVIATKNASAPRSSVNAILVNDIQSASFNRVPTADDELDRVLGGGLVPGSVILVGGEPGIGKSTLMLQISLKIPGKKVMYVSGEESEQQLKMRADRLKLPQTSCYVLAETNLQAIFQQTEILKPDLIIIDSIQTLQSDLLEASAGSVSQVRECTAQLQRLAKVSNTPLVLIGHITKDGSLAGPKVLEHMVDTVLQFEGDRNYGYRILRSVKNRFGSTSELGIYEMRSDGLREVSNPSEILLSHHEESLSGIAIAATMEGMRPLVLEIQALVSTAAYGTPQRSATGFDVRRMNMLLAVLEKRAGFRLGIKDVFLNVAGGIRVDDPASDLAVVSAILSSAEDIPIPPKYCFAAEVGLSGEIRSVVRLENRISEAEKLGFSAIFISKHAVKGLQIKPKNIRIIAVGKIEEVFENLFA